MSKTEMKTELEKLKAAAKVLEAKIDEMADDDGLWKPRDSEQYFFICSSGYTAVSKWHVCIGGNAKMYNRHDDNRYAVGNCFRTEELAEKEVARRKVTQRLRELAKGYEFSHDNVNWSLYHNGSCWCCTDWSCWNLQGAIQFKTEQAAQAAIDELGDELDILL